MANPVSAGTTVFQQQQPTINSGSAYSAGFNIGGLLSFTAAGAKTNGTGLLQSLTISDASNQNISTDVVMFSANPSNTTFSDRTALNISSADLGKIVGVVHVNDWSTFASNGVGQAQNVAMPFRCTGETVWAAMVARASATYTATSALTISLGVLQDPM